MCSSYCCSSSASFSTMSFNLSHPYSIFSIISLYNKEAVSHMLCSLSASASCVATTGADTALYNFVNWFLIQLVVFIICFPGNFFQNFWSFLWHSFSEAVILYQIVKKPIIWYHIPSTFFSDIFTNYFQLHGLSQVSPQPTFYSDTYFFCLRNYTSCAHMTPQPTFFNDVFTTYLRPSCVSQFYSSTNVFKWRIHHLSLYAWNVPFLILNQTFSMTYSPLILVRVGCLTQTVPGTATVPLCSPLDSSVKKLGKNDFQVFESRIW